MDSSQSPNGIILNFTKSTLKSLLKCEHIKMADTFRKRELGEKDLH